MPFEHEIKLPVASLAEIRSRLIELGASLVQAATFEDNWVLDDAARSVAAQGCLLRVRQWGSASFITFKGPARFAGGVKTRQELETSLGEARVALELLEALGYTPARRYQKRRETWTMREVTIALDETPMGSFVELEGDPEILPVLASQLRLDSATAVSGTYLHLWEAYRAAHPEAPADMVFP